MGQFARAAAVTGVAVGMNFLGGCSSGSEGPKPEPAWGEAFEAATDLEGDTATPMLWVEPYEPYIHFEDFALYANYIDTNEATPRDGIRAIVVDKRDDGTFSVAVQEAVFEPEDGESQVVREHVITEDVDQAVAIGAVKFACSFDNTGATVNDSDRPIELPAFDPAKTYDPTEC
jgi:hypothetical protein